MLGIKFLGALATAAFGAILAVTGLDSGPSKGAMLQAFEPTHVTGQDAGTDTCPVCKYGNLPAVQVWVNGGPSEDVTKIAAELDKQMAVLNKEQLRFKSFVIFKSEDGKKLAGKLAEIAKAGQLSRVAFTWLAPTNEALKEYKINPEAKTTVLVYRNRQVKDKFVDMKTDEAGLKELSASIDKIVK